MTKEQIIAGLQNAAKPYEEYYIEDNLIDKFLFHHVVCRTSTAYILDNISDCIHSALLRSFGFPLLP